MEDSEMIERLARTICKLRGVPPDDHHSDFDTQWQAVAGEAKGLLISMLEPTEHMTRAGAKMGGCDIDQARAIYRAMVDAAIDRNI